MTTKPAPFSKPRDGSSLRLDPDRRVTKPGRGRRGGGEAGNAQSARNGATRYLTAEEQSRQFVDDEDKFVLKQAKKKADIRVREGRAKPIDHLAFSLRFIDRERDVLDDRADDATLELRHPVTLVQDLSAEALRELDGDIQPYLVLEQDAGNKQYWQAVRAVAADRRTRLDPAARDDRLLKFVAGNVDKMLRGKDHDQLAKIETQCRAKLDSGEPIDADFWEQLLKEVRVRKARAQAEQLFQAILAARDSLLKTNQQQQQQQKHHDGTVKAAAAGASADPRPGEPDSSQATDALFDREAAQGLLENEEMFNAEEVVPAGKKPASWASAAGGEHARRKPRFFNRVQMGYEWNKYNQTHYDHDNPPPKIVQGYKFNIFYPELLDVTKTPTYRIHREGGRKRGESHAPAGEEDTCLIIFIAGPPYEDIAFRIVDREWDFSAKRERGFKSTFDKGILQLHFQFKKIFYRK